MQYSAAETFLFPSSLHKDSCCLICLKISLLSVSQKHFTHLISVTQRVALLHVTSTADLSSVTFLRATVAFSTAEYVPGSAHSRYNTRAMNDKDYLNCHSLTYHVKPLVVLHKCKYEHVILKQNKPFVLGSKQLIKIYGN